MNFGLVLAPPHSCSLTHTLSFCSLSPPTMSFTLSFPPAPINATAHVSVCTIFFWGEGKTERFAVIESEKGRELRDGWGEEGGVRQRAGEQRGRKGGERERKEGEHMCMLVTKGLGEGLREAR